MKLECLATGSLPHKDAKQALVLVKENFSIPFWPQLTRLNRNEDMIVQFTENMPSFFRNEEKCWLDAECEDFFNEVETFFEDFEAKNVLNYGITKDFSVIFDSFLELIKETKPAYAKGQIVGPFTLATTLVDKSGKCAIYDETLKEVIVKTLSLKALWQIEKIKEANPDTTPIIFLDEPSITQMGTSAFITIPPQDVTQMLREISDTIKSAGAISAVHCCGKCDWSVVLSCGADIINLDAYTYAQNLSLFYKDVEKFLQNGGKIAWGVVPTLDKTAIAQADLPQMINVFEQAVNYLTQKGIDEKIIIENSLVSTSCGAGGLSEELAQKALLLTRELSEALKERY